MTTPAYLIALAVLVVGALALGRYGWPLVACAALLTAVWVLGVVDGSVP